MTVETNTTFTEDTTSERVGQTTFLNSAPHSLKNRTIFPITVPIKIKDTGQEGLEPSTFGFGDRRSTFRATDLKYILRGQTS